MGLFLRGDTWHFQVQIHGIRYRKSTKTTNKKEAWRKLCRFTADTLGPEKRIAPRSLRRESVPYVYLFKAGDFYKIGFSGDPSKRLKDIQSSCPLPVEIIRTWIHGDAANIEMDLHALFASKRLEGEWFALDESDLG